MIDDSGTARIDMQSIGDINNYRYSAPENRFPEDLSMEVTPLTFEGDVFGMGMIVYEESSRCPARNRCQTLLYSRS